MQYVGSVVVALAMAALIGSTLRVYPHQLAYFNEASGGAENGYEHLVHSSLDWGQDLVLVREWMEVGGISPASVRIVSHGMLGRFATHLILRGASLSERPPTWTVYSLSRIGFPRGPSLSRAALAGGERIGYTMVACRNDRPQGGRDGEFDE